MKAGTKAIATWFSWASTRMAKREAALRRMEDTQSENQYLIHELNGMKKRLLSFEEFAKDAQPEALFTLVHSIVDRIYITTDGTKQKCQVYIKAAPRRIIPTYSAQPGT